MRFLLAVIALPVLALWSYTRWVWGRCALMWSARRRDPDPLSWVFRVRDALALVIVVAAALYWRWGRIDAGAEATATANGQLETAVFLIVVVLVLAVVFALIARPGYRRHALANIAIPLFAITTSILAFVLPTVLFVVPGAPLTALGDAAHAAVRDWAHVQNAGEFWPGAAFYAWSIGAALVVFVWLVTTLTVMAGAVWMGVGSRFRLGDAHPFMTAVAAVLLAVWAIGRGVVAGAGASDGDYPWWATWLLTFVGPTLVIAGSIWQIVRLHRRGIRFRMPYFAYEDDPISRAVARAMGRPIAPQR